MSKAVVVIPLHNHARWVWGAVESVARQDHKDKSAVVVDDGSTDGSFAAVLDRLSGETEVAFEATTLRERGRGACKWIGRTHNGMSVTVMRYEAASGPSFARNRGIEEALAQGADYIGLLDSDDEYAPTKLSRSIAAMEECPGIGAAYSDYDTIDPNGRRIREFKPAFSRAHLLRECIVNCDSVVSREAVEKVGLFDEGLRVAEDFDYWLRLSEHLVITHVPESLVTIRVGGHSSSATVKGEVWQACWRRVMEKVHERAQGGK